MYYSIDARVNHNQWNRIGEVLLLSIEYVEKHLKQKDSVGDTDPAPDPSFFSLMC